MLDSVWRDLVKFQWLGVHRRSEHHYLLLYSDWRIGLCSLSFYLSLSNSLGRCIVEAYKRSSCLRPMFMCHVNTMFTNEWTIDFELSMLYDCKSGTTCLSWSTFDTVIPVMFRGTWRPIHLTNTIASKLYQRW